MTVKAECKCDVCKGFREDNKYREKLQKMKNAGVMTRKQAKEWLRTH